MIRACAAFSLALWLLAVPARSEDMLPAFAPPTQYLPSTTKPFESLLAASVKWVQAKITDRKRRKRFQENRLRLPNGEDKRPVQAAIDKIDAELKDATADLAVLAARKPDVNAQKELVKSTVTQWIKGLSEKAESLRKGALDAEERVKKAARQFDAANANADAFEDRQNAEKAEKEAKALADDLAAAGL
jgi:hypothetical protein